MQNTEPKILMKQKTIFDENYFPFLKLLPSHLLDGPAVVYVNIFVRSISKIDDVVMVSDLHKIKNPPPPSTKQKGVKCWPSQNRRNV